MSKRSQVTSVVGAKTKSLLGRPWWQGIAGLVAIAALSLTVMAACWKSESVEQGNATSTSTEVNEGDVTNNATADDGSCIVQGSGSSCDVNVLPSPSRPVQPFVINRSWPLYKGCDGATDVAVLDATQSPKKMKLSAESDLRESIVSAGGAVVGQGGLYLHMTVLGDAVVHVTNFRPIIYKTGSVRPAWIFTPQGGCGGLDYLRVFEFNLDKKAIVDQGLQGEPEAGGDPVAHRSEPLGRSFSLTKSQAAEVLINVSGCHGYYEWGVRVYYSVDEREYDELIGTADKPFRSIGSIDTGVPAFTNGAEVADGLVPAGSVQRAHGCPTSS